MTHWEHWYEVVEDRSLRQGDIFTDIASFWLASDLERPEGDPDEHYRAPVGWTRDARIIVTASCDLDARAAKHVLLAPIGTADPETLRAQPGKEFDRRLEVLRRDLLPRMFMLAEFPEIEPPFPQSFAAWERLILLPTDYLRRYCEGPRLRLKSPYREKFGVWAGSRISAVGPEDHTQIPPGPRPPHDKHLLEGVDALEAG